MTPSAIALTKESNFWTCSSITGRWVDSSNQLVRAIFQIPPYLPSQLYEASKLQKPLLQGFPASHCFQPLFHGFREKLAVGAFQYRCDFLHFLLDSFNGRKESI